MNRWRLMLASEHAALAIAGIACGQPASLAIARAALAIVRDLSRVTTR